MFVVIYHSTLQAVPFDLCVILCVLKVVIVLKRSAITLNVTPFSTIATFYACLVIEAVFVANTAGV